MRKQREQRLSGIICLALALALSAGAGTFSGPTARVGLISGAAGGGNDPVFASLTHVWHMEEASGNSRADSVGSISLAETGGTVSRGTGIHGFAADFNSSHVLLNASTIDDNPYTVAFWIKVRSVPLVAAQIASFACDTGPYFMLNIDGSIGFNDQVAGSDDGEINTPLSTNMWHLIVGTADGDVNYKLYVDGSLIDSVNGSGNTPLGAINVGDLNSCTGNATSLDALVDELMTFSTDIGQAGVTSLLTHFYSP